MVVHYVHYAFVLTIYFNQLTARVKSTKVTCRHAGFPFLPYLTAFPALISFY